MAQLILNNLEAGGSIRSKINTNFTELYTSTATNEQKLIEWSQGKDYELITITRDSEGRITTSTVKWPDSSNGTYLANDYNATHEVYDGYSIIHADSGLVITQSAVTRNIDGAVILKPALTIA